MGSEFDEFNAKRVGISPDSVNRQRQFDDKNTLGFPLLSDPKGEAARVFGVKRIGLLPPIRTTFVIGQDRRLIRVIRSETNMTVHADEALAALRALPT